MVDRSEPADENALRCELQELAKQREALDTSKRQGSTASDKSVKGRRSVLSRLGGAPRSDKRIVLKETHVRGNSKWLGKRDQDDTERTIKRQRLHSAVARPEGSHDSEVRIERTRSPDRPSSPCTQAQERKQRAVAPYAQKDTIARSRRMFGALMGHLGKAKRQIEKDTDLFKRQDIKQQEAEQREKLQSQTLEAQARREAAVTRLETLIARTELDRNEQIARTKLDHLQMVRKSQNQSKFLLTIASPPIYYLPAKHTKETKELVAASIEAHEAKVKASSQMYEEKLRQLETEFSTKLDKYHDELEALRKETTEKEEKENDESMTQDNELEDRKSRPGALKTDLKRDEEQDTERKSSSPLKTMNSPSSPVTAEKEQEKPEIVETTDQLEETQSKPATPKDTPSVTVHKMKVTELRAELLKRGLSTKGLKATLVERLKQAMQE